MSHKVFKYPVTEAESHCFATQKEAIQMKEKSPDSIVISFEVSLEGSRRYLVTTVPYFWGWYKNTPVKNHYEVICDNHISKLYCDIEYKKVYNQGKDGYKSVKRLIKLINEKANQDFSLSVSEEDCLVLEATDEAKFSIHLIFNLIVFDSNKACKNFMKDLMESLETQDQALFDVKNGSGGVTSCIDMSVYSSNRSFRMFESSKFGQKRPLIVSPIDISTLDFNSDLTDEEKRKKIFLKSLITYCCGERRINSYEHSKEVPRSMNQHTEPNTTLEKINEKFSTKFVTRGQIGFVHKKTESSKSLKIQNIEEFINSKVLPGKIWKTVTDGEIITFFVKNYQCCRKIGRPHTSKNQIYFKFYLTSDTLMQCCFSRSCKMLPDKIINLED